MITLVNTWMLSAAPKVRRQTMAKIGMAQMKPLSESSNLHLKSSFLSRERAKRRGRLLRSSLGRHNRRRQPGMIRDQTRTRLAVMVRAADITARQPARCCSAAHLQHRLWQPLASSSALCGRPVLPSMALRCEHPMASHNTALQGSDDMRVVSSTEWRSVVEGGMLHFEIARVIPHQADSSNDRRLYFTPGDLCFDGW